MDASPLLISLYACVACAAVCWLLSVVTRDYSWVDRLWSIVPALYVGWFAATAGRIEPRLIIMTVLIGLWAGRLTYNFARKGGYRPGGEDYRWPIVRERIPPALFQVFNVVFIAAAQNVLLWLLAYPAWIAREHGPTPLGWLDAVAVILCAVFIIGEAVADEQQWQFHQDKQARIARGEPVEHEFLTTGLFRYSRHPNYFCEQALWWSFCLFGVAAGADWLNVSLLGAALLTLLFQGSTPLTEGITLSKYPAYAEYRRRTSRLIPWFPG